jgi:hypothetical protein
MRARDSRRMVGSRRRQVWVEDVVSTQRYGDGAAAQQAETGDHPRGKGKMREGVEARIEVISEGIEAFCTRAEGPSGEEPQCQIG